MQITGNYKLKKPEASDLVNIQDFNDNADIIDSELAKKAEKAVATQSASGLMSAADKKKLDGVATGANNYTHPSTSGNKHIPTGGASGQFLKWSADGTAVWAADNNTTYSDATTSAHGLMTAADKTKLNGIETGAQKNKNGYSVMSVQNQGSGGIFDILATKADDKFTLQLNLPLQCDTYDTANKSYRLGILDMKGATTSVVGERGLVPVPSAGAANRYLRSDGTWAVPPDTNTTYSNFVKSGSTAKAGLVPAPSTTAGTKKYLREDGTWQIPPDTNTTYKVFSVNNDGLVPATADVMSDSTTARKYFLNANGEWSIPSNNADGANKILWEGFFYSNELRVSLPNLERFTLLLEFSPISDGYNPLSSYISENTNFDMTALITFDTLKSGFTMANAAHTSYYIYQNKYGNFFVNVPVNEIYATGNSNTLLTASIKPYGTSYELALNSNSLNMGVALGIVMRRIVLINAVK